MPRETLGDLLRALGQNPTQAEVADIVASAPREGMSVLANFGQEVLITTCMQLTTRPSSLFSIGPMVSSPQVLLVRTFR